MGLTERFNIQTTTRSRWPCFRAVIVNLLSSVCKIQKKPNLTAGRSFSLLNKWGNNYLHIHYLKIIQLSYTLNTFLNCSTLLACHPKTLDMSFLTHICFGAIASWIKKRLWWVSLGEAMLLVKGASGQFHWGECVIKETNCFMKSEKGYHIWVKNRN